MIPTLEAIKEITEFFLLYKNKHFHVGGKKQYKQS